MKILFVMPKHISYGGIETVGINLWKGLTERGHHIDFVCHGYEIGVFEKDILEAGSAVFHIPVKGKDYIGMKREYKKIIKKGRYTVVHAHMNATSGIYLQIAKEYNVPVLVAHSHASSMKAFTSNPFKALINTMEKSRTNKYANIRIACSDLAGAWLFKQMPYKTVLNAVDTHSFAFSEEIRKSVRRKLKISDNCFLAIHVGGFLDCKNHLYLIEIFQQIKKLNQDAILFLIGDGPLKGQIVKKVRECGVEDSVAFMGQRKDVNELLQAADVFLLPSVSEGNPVALAEAAVSGLHCIVSANVAREIIKYFEKGSIEFLQIIDRNNERTEEKKENDITMHWAKRALSQWKRVCYSEEFPCKLSFDFMTAQIEALYKGVLGNV